MMSARPVLRASINNTFRASRAAGRAGRPRFESTSTQSSAASRVSSNSHLLTSLGAGAAGGLVAYGIWYMTPSGRMSRKLNKAAYDANSYYKDATNKLAEKAPNTDQALDGLKQYAYTYVSWVPGGRGVVDTAFRDIDKVREKHGKEVDDIVRNTYDELRQIAQEGISMQSLQKTAGALNRFVSQIASIAGGSLNDLLDNHPQIKNQIGQPIQQLQQMGESLGPEAKEQVDKTWEQFRDIMKSGVSAESLYKAKNLIQEKTELIRGMADDMWKKGLEQAKPMLDKNPKVKKLIEENESALKQGNAREIFQKIRESVQSGNTSSLEDYVSQAANKTKDSAGGFNLGGLERYAKMIPGGDEIVPKLSQLQKVAQDHRQEGEQLLKETMTEIQKVLSKQADKAKDLVEKSK